MIRYLPALLPLLIMLPRLVSSQFGLLDDGRTLATASQFVIGDFATWDAQLGRFRPMYWHYWSLIYRIAGENPFAFFISNTVLFAALTAGLIKFVGLVGGTKRQAWMTGLFFALSGPVIENFYTLSKAEPIQLLWLMASLLVMAGLINTRSRRRQVTGFLLAGVAILFASATKETSLAILPISLAWLVGAIALSRRSRNPIVVPTLGIYLLAGIVGTVGFLALRGDVVELSLTGQGYTDQYRIDMQQILASGVRWSGWLIRDFAYILPPAALAAGWMLTSRRSPNNTPLLLGSFAWMVGWVFVYLPWAFTVEYFMLPLAAGTSIFAAVSVDIAIGALRSGQRAWRTLSGLSLMASVIFLGITIINNANNARLQIAVDQANTEMLRSVSQQVPAQGLLIVNIQDPNEYYDEIKIHLSTLHDRPDIQVDYFRYQSSLLEGEPEYYVLMPEIVNQIPLSVRLGVREPSVAQWNRSMEEFLGGRAVDVHSTDRSFRLFNIDLPRLLCPLFSSISYCSARTPTIDRRVFLYGWRLLSAGIEG